MTDRTIHQLTQGTPEWHQFRLTHYGASEAAAMLGISSKVSRNDLLHMKSTGTAQEFSDWVQVNILNHGHEVEKAAMPYVENIIGEALYPVTCSLGVMSASCDGLNLDETIAFEHKQWNAELADSVDAGVLPDEYQPQCQQIMMVTGAEMVIFVVSDGTPDMMVSMDVFPDADWQDRIAAGWDQFAIDQSGYEHVEYAVKPVADAILALPALAVQIRGEVMMSNLPAVSASVEKFVASIKTDLQTDEDFANAEKTIKFCDDAEKMLDAALNGAMAQTASIDELKRTVEMLQSQLRDKRLSLTATVKQKKESLKNGILAAVKEKFAEHVTALERVIQPIRLVFQARDFAGVMKNKRTLKTLQDAVDAELAAAKVSVNMLAKTMRARLDWYELHAKDHKFLFSDLQNIIQKPDEDFQMVVNNRIEVHKKQEALKAEQAAAALVEKAPTPVAVQVEPTPVHPETMRAIDGYFKVVVSRDDLVLAVKEARDSLTAAEAALFEFDTRPENNVYQSLADAGALEEILYQRAFQDCEGAGNCGSPEYRQEFLVAGVKYVAIYTPEFNRHDKTYYYIDGFDFKIEPCEAVKAA